MDVSIVELTDQDLDLIAGGSVREGLGDIVEGVQDLTHANREGFRDILEGLKDIIHH